MVKVGVLGGSEFIVGFQLAGIRDTFEATEKPLEDFNTIRKNKDMSVVIVDDKILNKLEEHERLNIEDSIKPVFIPLSTESAQEGLRRLIIKSIGIDLWKDDNR